MTEWKLRKQTIVTLFLFDFVLLLSLMCELAVYVEAVLYVILKAHAIFISVTVLLATLSVAHAKKYVTLIQRTKPKSKVFPHLQRKMVKSFKAAPHFCTLYSNYRVHSTLACFCSLEMIRTLIA